MGTTVDKVEIFFHIPSSMKPYFAVYSGGYAGYGPDLKTASEELAKDFMEQHGVEED